MAAPEHVSAFMDHILQHGPGRTKNDMITVWNHIVHPPVQTEKCIFVITRGEKMGQMCGSRTKKGHSVCMKHYKEPKGIESVAAVLGSDETTVVTEVPEDVPVETQKIITLNMKFRRATIPLETEVLHSYRVVKGTVVVVNACNQIMGYLEQGELIRSANKETQRIEREYQLEFNRDGLPTLDE